MPTRNAPRLDSVLIARKGEASPSTSPTVPVEPLPPEAQPPVFPIASAPTRTPHGTSGTIAVTVRLDPERYETLKIHGVKKRLTNQDILVAALDHYLSQNSTSP